VTAAYQNTAVLKKLPNKNYKIISNLSDSNA
jgi:hypothetical protein